MKTCRPRAAHYLLLVVTTIKELFIKYKDIILYLIFGGLTTLLNVVSYYLLYDICGVSNGTSTVIAWFLSVLFAYLTNRRFVFESKSKSFKTIAQESAAFFTARIATGILDLAIMVIAVDLMNLNSLLWKILSNILVIILNYILSKFWIFKK